MASDGPSDITRAASVLAFKMCEAPAGTAYGDRLPATGTLKMQEWKIRER